MRSEQEVNRVIELYGDTVRRLCMIYLKNYAVELRYISKCFFEICYKFSKV